ncbi:MAG: hypothetical protein A2161_09105 [Candidatus Schekmanbacteria bacterium RBG_13_48_7]|uniref:Uncharacterized protein n=1 Tax=Candidatus Schekmanbacteria bacterium RBG_13_48_7 TaxID=1817878 RepID=A0A1F7S0T3_9BACT|nr:MAG: hypothetical protein A2161_09105 [Candidatus Schekmanbacteria bacterium RBG_13_48_7]
MLQGICHNCSVLQSRVPDRKDDVISNHNCSKCGKKLVEIDFNLFKIVPVNCGIFILIKER